jgi:hypothetical protein
MTNTNTKVSELTKEKIAEQYFESLENPRTRNHHVLLGFGKGGGDTNPKQTHIPPHDPSPNDVRADFTCWYGGCIALAQMIDPGTNLPSTETMVEYVAKNFDRAKAAIAA